LDVDIPIDVGEFAITLNAENQAVALQEIAWMDAAQPAVDVNRIDGAKNDETRIEVDIGLIVAPGISALQADIWSGPVIGGRIDNVGGQCSGSCEKGSNTSKKDDSRLGRALDHGRRAIGFTEALNDSRESELLGL
jgi:hypothetical protein